MDVISNLLNTNYRNVDLSNANSQTSVSNKFNIICYKGNNSNSFSNIETSSEPTNAQQADSEERRARPIFSRTFTFSTNMSNSGANSDNNITGNSKYNIFI